MTVLLVEDEDLVRELVRRFLELGGYEVLDAASGEAALDVAEAWTGEIRVVVTDVLLPGMNGAEFALRLKALIPAIKIIFMSGHPGDSTPHEILETGAAFLSKPFTRRMLLDMIAEVLAE